MTTRIAALAALLCMMATAALSQARDLGPGAMGRPGDWSFQGGEAVYSHVCQDCHMADARGAVGAGAYPSLVKDKKLLIAAYPIGVIINGQKAMIPLGAYLSDQQIADVVNYVRTHFGNSFRDKVTPSDVKALR
jgi:mono/diheme cytochrome c family protein